MSKKKQFNFIPPSNPIDITDIKIKSAEEMKDFKKSKAYLKYVKPAIKRDKELKRLRFTGWWKENWISFLSLVFAFIASIPVIIGAVVYLLSTFT